MRGPYCFDCKRPLPYWEDESSGCFVVEQSLREYVGFYMQANAVTVPEYLKRLVLEAYERKCFGCGITGHQVSLSIDHILPRATGGDADIFNLQPLCEACGNEKGDMEPKVQNVALFFLLLPLPGETYEGWIW